MKTSYKEERRISKIMVSEKKGVTLSGIRVSERTAKDYKNALKHYSLSRADFARMCIDGLIQHYQAHDPLALPIGFNLQDRAKRNRRQAN